MNRFEEKAVLITGGGGELAQATAARLLEEGAVVLLTDSNGQSLENARSGLLKQGYKASRIATAVGDVCDQASCDAVANAAAVQLGKVDALVCTAGIIRNAPVDQMAERDWQDVINVNLTGIFHSVKAAVPHMKERQYGRIVLVSSLGGRTGRPNVSINYAASKAGVVGMTMSLAYELGPHGITANCVAPGPLRSNMFAAFSEDKIHSLMVGLRVPRLGEMSDIAAAIAYLASDDAAWTTGEVLDVNGGLYY